MPMATKEEQREYQRIWILKRRQEWINENGPCAWCGVWDNLEVDHINPKDKTMHVSRVWSMAKTNPIRVNELAKCQVLCVPCHDKKTKAESQRDIPHGTNSWYRRGCKCALCREWKRLARLRETRNRGRLAE